MADPNKKTRLLCSVSNTEPAVLQVFDMNLGDVGFADLSCDGFHESKLAKSKRSDGGYQKQEKYNKSTRTEMENPEGLDKSMSMATGLGKQHTHPSSRVSQQKHEEYSFRPTLSKRSQELAKIRSNLNLSIFQDLYCRKPKCNHNNQCREKPPKQKNSSIRQPKTERNSIRESDYPKIMNAGQRQRRLTGYDQEADRNLMHFLNKRLFGLEPS